MSTDPITARNRANAQRSTGPKTAEGKAIVAGNARQHGATARPDPGSVAAWLAIILDRPEITPGDLLPGDDAGYRALALAEAEVRVVATEAALREFEAGVEEPSEAQQELRRCKELIAHELRQDGVTGREKLSGLALLTRITKFERDETVERGRRHRLLRRYVREARSERRKAFAAWALARGDARKAA